MGYVRDEQGAASGWGSGPGSTTKKGKTRNKTKQKARQEMIRSPGSVSTSWEGGGGDTQHVAGGTIGLSVLCS